MYTSIKSVQIVLALLKQHGIRRFVINPGSTNIPLVSGIQNDPFFTCYSIVDERSAIYFAIGLYLESGEPVAASCTSAQATRNYIPGLTEAFYKHVPILAITASKHPRYTYQEYMQAPNQTSLPEDAVKKSFGLPVVDSYHDELHCERIVNEAILELTHRVSGPVQINIPIVDSEVGLLTAPKLPRVHTIKRYMEWEDWELSLENKKIMVVIGEHRPFTSKQVAIIEAFTEAHNAFVYTNHLSNYHGKHAISANLALTGMSVEVFNSSYKPDILITIGGQTGDYPLYNKLSAGDRFLYEHWRVSEDGNIVDPYDKLTKVFECPFERFFTRLTNNDRVEHTYFESWVNIEKSTNIPDNLPFSNAYLAQQLHSALPPKSYLNLSILNSLRVWEYFPLDPSIICYSNVAAFGIDGCMSVSLGQSVATEELCFLVIGDLSFFYDMNSLGIRHLKNNIRILLVNNHCGTEFKLHSHPAGQLGDESDAFIAAAGHYSDAKGWAETNKFKYISAYTKEEFLQYKDSFTRKSDHPIVFEVFTNALDESDALKNILENNRIESFVKSTMRSLLGDKGVKLAKNIRQQIGK